MTLKIEPTVMDSVTWDDAVMKEEIFGPILPIMSYYDLKEAVSAIDAQSRPLALYLFTKDKKGVFHFKSSLMEGDVSMILSFLSRRHTCCLVERDSPEWESITEKQALIRLPMRRALSGNHFLRIPLFGIRHFGII